MYVRATDSWKNRLTGLCGPYDGNTNNDPTSPTILNSTFWINETFLSSMCEFVFLLQRANVAV